VADHHNIPVPDPTALTQNEIDTVKTDLRRELHGLRDVLNIRVDALDRALLVRHESQDHDIVVLKELMREQLSEVTIRFAERDLRYDQRTESSKEAISAALSAAKEAADKAEASFTKQLDSMSVVIATQDKAQTERIGELKERIDRGEGTDRGASQTESNIRATATARQNAIMVALFGISALLGTIGIIISLFHHP
jgi:hypothetical protein